MIIQIQCTARKTWSNLCSCTHAEADIEIKHLKKIYRFNKFRIIEGDGDKIPGPLYIKKTQKEVDKIVGGVDWLMKQRKDNEYAGKVMHVLKGNLKG